MRHSTIFAQLCALALSVTRAHAQYKLIKDYSGTQFFSGWDFINGFDNTTNGHVNYLSEANATAAHLAFVDESTGRAVIRLDNTSFVPYNEKRNSVSISTHDFFPVGTVLVFDAAHLPFGCSVWPAFWTKGQDWPRGGEIDVLEAVNRASANQMTLHASPGCVQAPDVVQLGKTNGADCSQGVNSSVGCTVLETQADSFGDGFNGVGGGVWATQFDVSGIFVWFWSRPNVPADVNNATTVLNTSAWGTPSAAWPASSCNITQFFAPQQIVLDITLCGDFAGQPQIYQSTCGGPLGNSTYDTCYINNVINNGTSDYANAYFEINYVKAFSLGDAVDPSGNPDTSTTGSGSSGTTSGTTASPTTTASGSGDTTGTGSSGASVLGESSVRSSVYALVVSGVAALFGTLAAI